jgi:Kef-type K+ transport system membrane component KefB
MIPRGEVGMIVAQIGLGFGILSRSSYSVVVFMSVATTVVAPPLLKIAYRSLLESRGPQLESEVLRLG